MGYCASLDCSGVSQKIHMRKIEVYQGPAHNAHLTESRFLDATGPARTCQDQPGRALGVARTCQVPPGRATMSGKIADNLRPRLCITSRLVDNDPGDPEPVQADPGWSRMIQADPGRSRMLQDDPEQVQLAARRRVVEVLDVFGYARTRQDAP